MSVSVIREREPEPVPQKIQQQPMASHSKNTPSEITLDTVKRSTLMDPIKRTREQKKESPLKGSSASRQNAGSRGYNSKKVGSPSTKPRKSGIVPSREPQA